MAFPTALFTSRRLWYLLRMRSSQGCQMKISIKSQTMLKRGQKKAKPIVQRQEKIKISKKLFEIKIKSCLALYWSSLLMLLLLFRVCEIAHFGQNSATVWILIHRQLSEPIQKLSPIHSCSYNQNHYSASTSRRHYRISIGRRRPACQRWHNTNYTVQWVHAFPVITQKYH